MEHPCDVRPAGSVPRAAPPQQIRLRAGPHSSLWRYFQCTIGSPATGAVKYAMVVPIRLPM